MVSMYRKKTLKDLKFNFFVIKFVMRLLYQLAYSRDKNDYIFIR